MDVVYRQTQVEVLAQDDEQIQLNFPDNVELKILVDYVSERLSINVIYDDQQMAQRVTIRAPSKVPRQLLMGLLQSVLRQKNLLLTESGTPGWFKIVQMNNLAGLAEPATQPTTRRAGENTDQQVLAQIFSLRHADTAKVDQIIRPFLTTPGGNSVTVPELKLLIVTDYAENVRKVEILIQSLDHAGPPAVIEMVDVKHGDPQALATQMQQLLESKAKTTGPSLTRLEVQPDLRTGRIILLGTQRDVDEGKALVRKLDVAVPVQTITYQLRFVAPERIDKLSKELAAGARPAYQSVIDRDAGILIVTAAIPIHVQVESLVKRLDVAVESEEQSPIRFHKLYNTTAADILQTLQAIEGENGVGQIQVTASTPPTPSLNGAIENAPPLTNLASPQPPGLGNAGPFGLAVPNVSGPAQPRSTLKTKDATVTADPNTNTIIIVARPAIQRTYEEITRNLDKRRPQVLIECTIVTLDTTNNFSFGVELSARGGFGVYDALSFSSFGLSKVDGKTGELSLTPGLGFNGALLSSDVADIVIRALKSNGRSDVISAPKVLVNDHSTGVLSSVDESPFTSVNASNTVSTTSFGGYASAGTTISVTPHISEADHLQLDYVVALNSFTGSGGTGIPPPRQSNTLQSKVTIPDGSTIVVGGLNRRNDSQTKDAIPLLGEIPGLGALFSSTTKQNRVSTLFVFIRPIILRDDQFEDLKYLSAQDVRKALLPSGDPVSEAVEME